MHKIKEAARREAWYQQEASDWQQNIQFLEEGMETVKRLAIFWNSHKDPQKREPHAYGAAMALLRTVDPLLPRLQDPTLDQETIEMVERGLIVCEPSFASLKEALSKLESESNSRVRSLWKRPSASAQRRRLADMLGCITKIRMEVDLISERISPDEDPLAPTTEERDSVIAIAINSIGLSANGLTAGLNFRQGASLYSSELLLWIEDQRDKLSRLIKQFDLLRDLDTIPSPIHRTSELGFVLEMLVGGLDADVVNSGMSTMSGDFWLANHEIVSDPFLEVEEDIDRLYRLVPEIREALVPPDNTAEST